MTKARAIISASGSPCSNGSRPIPPRAPRATSMRCATTPLEEPIHGSSRHHHAPRAAHPHDHGDRDRRLGAPHLDSDDRNNVVSGKGGTVRVYCGGRRQIKKTTTKSN